MKIKFERKILIELAILAAVALVSLIYIGVRDRGEINYKLPDFPAVSAEDMTRIDITYPDGSSIGMGKKGNSWELTDGYPADENTLSTILNALEEFTPVDLVSESGNPGRYELDEGNRYRVRAYRGDDLLREVFLGKTSASGSYNYVLFPGSDKIYTLRGALVKTLDKPKDNFRSKKAMTVNRNAVVALELKTAEGLKVLTKGGDDQWVNQDGIIWDNAKVQDIIGRAATLQAVGFPSTTPINGSEVATLTIRGDKVQTLTLYPPTQEGYIAISSDYPHPVLITEYAGNTIQENFRETLDEQ